MPGMDADGGGGGDGGPEGEATITGAASAPCRRSCRKMSTSWRTPPTVRIAEERPTALTQIGPSHCPTRIQRDLPVASDTSARPDRPSLATPSTRTSCAEAVTTDGCEVAVFNNGSPAPKLGGETNSSPRRAEGVGAGRAAGLVAASLRSGLRVTVRPAQSKAPAISPDRAATTANAPNPFLVPSIRIRPSRSDAS